MTVRRIRLGMIGGGPGAFIGAVHRIAARLDDQFELVAACVSTDPQRASAGGQALGLPAERSYGTYQDMLSVEQSRSDGIEAVALVTPNSSHYPIARACLELGLHVICDKPLTATVEEASQLAQLVRPNGPLLLLTHTYSGYPLIRHAKASIAKGLLGAIRVVNVEYAQGWLSQPIEGGGSKQASWRLDPSRGGPGGCVADIGTHAFHLVEFVTGLRISEVAAELTSFGRGRQVPDDAQVLLRFNGGAKGSLWASQVALGEQNNLVLRVYGDQGSFTWRQETPDELHFSSLNSPTAIIRRGDVAAGPEAAAVTRLPPEGYLEAFANLYREAAQAIRARQEQPPRVLPETVVGVQDGLDGMYFVEAVLRSGERNGNWTALRRAVTNTKTQRSNSSAK